MDERQQDIKVGAGQEESRLNTDLIDFLQSKYFTGFLVLVVIVSGGYFLYQIQQRRQAALLDQAFAEYGLLEQEGSPAPTSLASVAEEYAGVGSVGELANLRLGDLHLRAAVSGVAPGAEIDQVTGEFVDPETALLDDEGRSFHLDRAASAYRQVLEATRDVAARRLLAVNAAFGLAAVQETRDDFEGARGHLETAATLAREGGFGPLAAAAEERLSFLESPPSRQPLLSREELPPRAGADLGALGGNPVPGQPMTSGGAGGLDLLGPGPLPPEPVAGPQPDPASPPEPEPAGDPDAPAEPGSPDGG